MRGERVLKKVILLVFIGSVILLSGCSEAKSSTSSYIKVIDKGITKQQYWVEAINPYLRQPQRFKLTIDQENTWNLIEKDNEYLAIYAYTSLDKGADLLSIKHPAKINE
jgi:hypothetical protein